MKTSSAKQKGRRLQNKIVMLLRELYKIDQDLGLYEGEIQAQPMGQVGIDVKISTAFEKRIPLAIECKNQETWQIEKWYQQTKKNTKKGQIPTLIVSKNNTKPIVITDLEYFLKLVKKVFDHDIPKNSDSK